MIRTLVIGSLLCLNWSLKASAGELPQGELARSQSESASERTDESSSDLRIQQIESARAEKEANLRPEAEPELQYRIKWAESSIPYKLMTSQFNGFGVGFGRMVSGAGFAIGPQYSRGNLMGGRLDFKTGGRVSTNRSYLGRVDLSFHDLLGGRAFLNFGAEHRDFSEMPYYGPGPNSEKSGRTDYRLEDTTVELRPGITPLRHLSAGVIGAYYKVNVGPGRSGRYISSELKYTPEDAPGIDRQTSFWRGGAFLDYDWRDRNWAPTSGGKYSAQYTRYLDRDLDSFSYLRLDFDAAQYIPLFNHTRVITLHGATSLSKNNGTQRVPFYLQPTLGGADTLRGYQSYRFYGHDSLLINAEYRWDISPTASLMGFADCGRVFDRWAQWNLHKCESDVGFGFAFRSESKVVFRIDTGFSHEGVQVWFRANNLY